MVNGVLYMSSAVGAVVALDPATGKTLWFDTLPPRPDGQGLARGGATRSLAYWTDGRDARIVTNVGANLVALNAKTGKRYRRLRRQRSGRSDQGLRACRSPAGAGAAARWS